MAKPRIAVLLGSTREARFCHVPGRWICDYANQRQNWDVELVDLKEFDLPFFDEPATDLFVPSQEPRAVAWQSRIAKFDGFIFVVAEYNHSITGALKNALDQAYKAWNRKPAAFVGYGGVGAARAVEHLRNICVELQMVPTRTAVHIGGSEFRKVHPPRGSEPITAIEEIIRPSADAMLDELVWWTMATKAARDQSAA